MLVASPGTGAIGRATVGTIGATVRMLLRMLVLLQVQKMLLLMVRMWQATSSGHAELLLLLLLVIATGQLLLTVDASGHQNHRSIGTLL